MAKKKSNNWGGSRPGSGSQKKWDEATVGVAMRLPESVVAKLDAVAKMDGINRVEALVKLINPGLFNKANPVVIQRDPGPQREKVIATEL